MVRSGMATRETVGEGSGGFNEKKGAEKEERDSKKERCSMPLRHPKVVVLQGLGGVAKMALVAHLCEWLKVANNGALWDVVEKRGAGPTANVVVSKSWLWR